VKENRLFNKPIKFRNRRKPGTRRRILIVRMGKKQLFNMILNKVGGGADLRQVGCSNFLKERSKALI